MTADERIRAVNCEAWIQGFTGKGLVLSHWKDIEADVVVFGTGFESMEKVVEEIIGREAAERVGDIGYLNEEGERIGSWRPTGVPGLWYMTGSSLWTRTFSAVLALQIAAVERGLNLGHYEHTGDMRLRMRAD